MDPILSAILAALSFIGKGALEGGKMVGSTLLEGGKMAGKGLKQISDWGVNRMQQGAKLNPLQQPNTLANAFGSFITPSAEAATIPEVPTQSMQYVPGPEGNVIGGLGEVMPGYGMQSPQSTIPQAYRNIDLGKIDVRKQQPSIPMDILKMFGQGVGIGRGEQSPIGIPEAFLKGSLGMPMDQERMGMEAYIGKLIPDIYRSKLGVNTTGEESRQKQIMESYSTKKSTPEYKADLEKSVQRLPQLDEQQKISLYQQLAVQYPEKSTELKRIFFPQTQDSNEALMALIASGMNR